MQPLCVRVCVCWSLKRRRKYILQHHSSTFQFLNGNCSILFPRAFWFYPTVGFSTRIPLCHLMWVGTRSNTEHTHSHSEPQTHSIGQLHIVPIRITTVNGFFFGKFPNRLNEGRIIPIMIKTHRSPLSPECTFRSIPMLFCLQTKRTLKQLTSV